MLRAIIYHQIAVLLDPAKLQLDAVQNSQFLIRIPEIVKTAMQPLILFQLRHSCLVGIVNINVLGKAPLLPALLQKINEFYHRVTWCNRIFQVCVVVNLLSQRDQTSVRCNALEKHRDRIRRLTGICRIHSAGKLLPLDPSRFHF